MKATEFVKKYGWLGVKEYLAGATFFNDNLLVFTDVEDLQNIVNAYELVIFIGNDLDGAKQVYEFTKNSVNIAIKDRVILVLDLKQAIELVESVNE